MKAKLLGVICLFLLLSGCCSNGLSAWDSSSGAGCNGCDVGYWSTKCPTPSTNGASEAAFTDIANSCDGETCSYNYYSGCNANGCNSGMNW